MPREKLTGRFDTREELEEFVLARGRMGAHRTLIAKQSGIGEGTVMRLHLDNGIRYEEGRRPKSRTFTLGASKTRGPYASRDKLERRVVISYKKSKSVRITAKDNGISLPTVRKILKSRNITIVKAQKGEETTGKYKTKDELDKKVCEFYTLLKTGGYRDIINNVAKRTGVSAPTARKILAVNGLVKTKNKELNKRIAHEC